MLCADGENRWSDPRKLIGMSSPTSAPVHCRGEAYRLFAAQLPRIEQPDALLRAAAAISLHELRDAELGDVVARVERITDTVRQRVRTCNPRTILAHAHAVLFEEMGFTGNAEDYYNPRNSYVPAVLETRRGIPITLALIYNSVLAPLGVAVVGINAPAHFLVSVDIDADGNRMLVDPFHAGRVWDAAPCWRSTASTRRGGCSR